MAMEKTAMKAKYTKNWFWELALETPTYIASRSTYNWPYKPNDYEKIVFLARVGFAFYCSAMPDQELLS